mmetsp:Transcript_34699/g.104830  ORF Transcript_34699/g.104830 Transcript_34699/m.104830 type:complete len:295 (+) Transcript_34699:1071-1955(+)
MEVTGQLLADGEQTLAQRFARLKPAVVHDHPHVVVSAAVVPLESLHPTCAVRRQHVRHHGPDPEQQCIRFDQVKQAGVVVRQRGLHHNEVAHLVKIVSAVQRARVGRHSYRSKGPELVPLKDAEHVPIFLPRVVANVKFTAIRDQLDERGTMAMLPRPQRHRLRVHFLEFRPLGLVDGLLDVVHVVYGICHVQFRTRYTPATPVCAEPLVGPGEKAVELPAQEGGGSPICVARGSLRHLLAPPCVGGLHELRHARRRRLHAGANQRVVDVLRGEAGSEVALQVPGGECVDARFG